MTRLTKKLLTNRPTDFEPGEEPVATTLVQPHGTTLPVTIIIAAPLLIGVLFFGAIGGALGAAFAVTIYSLAPKVLGSSPSGGHAASVGKGPCVLAVTNRRVLAFGHNNLSGKPTALHAGFPIDQVASVAWTKGTIAGTLTVAFVDGSTAVFDALKSAKPEPFVETFHHVAGR